MFNIDGFAVGIILKNIHATLGNEILISFQGEIIILPFEIRIFKNLRMS